MPLECTYLSLFVKGAKTASVQNRLISCCFGLTDEAFEGFSWFGSGKEVYIEGQNWKTCLTRKNGSIT